jgi:Bacterial PH domain
MRELIRLGKHQLEIDQVHLFSGLFKLHREQIEKRLRRLGTVQYDLWLPETHVLPIVIQPNEQIKGIVYGRYKENVSQKPATGRGALMLTDRRVILIDRKPLFIKCDEVNYQSIKGIEYAKVGLSGTVVLYTRVGNITVRTLNQKCANRFVKAVENIILTARK